MKLDFFSWTNESSIALRSFSFFWCWCACVFLKEVNLKEVSYWTVVTLRTSTVVKLQTPVRYENNVHLSDFVRYFEVYTSTDAFSCNYTFWYILAMLFLSKPALLPCFQHYTVTDIKKKIYVRSYFKHHSVEQSKLIREKGKNMWFILRLHKGP